MIGELARLRKGATYFSMYLEKQDAKPKNYNLNYALVLKPEQILSIIYLGEIDTISSKCLVCTSFGDVYTGSCLSSHLTSEVNGIRTLHENETA